jgi:hypothetical protein
MRATKIELRKQQQQLFCGRYMPTNAKGADNIPESEVEKILDLWR